jgi:glycosyltransferase involved in cell wall biosynthesis
MVESQPDKQIGYILRSYPRLTQTFVLNEILALEQIGVSIQVYALTNPHEQVVQSQVSQVRAPVHYLDEAIQLRPRCDILREHINVAGRYFKEYIASLLYIALNRGIDQGYTASNRWACFSQAISLISQLALAEEKTGRKIDHLHAHFAHDPALVAYLVHRIMAIPFSFTAHARDLYQVPQKALVDRIRPAIAVVTCCHANLEYLNEIAPSEQSKFKLVYHGVNLKDFQPILNSSVKPISESPLILSVGRLVEKKGFQDLLQALLIVKEKGKHFQCAIYGDGPLCQQLDEWIKEHDMSGEVMLNGNRTQQELISVYRNATLFALTPIPTKDGDRDGVPNVLFEAMAMGLPVISTNVAGVSEAVDDKQTGLLYQPHDVEGIASGIIELLSDENKRERLGRAASQKVMEQFDIIQAANRLKTLFV